MGCCSSRPKTEQMLFIDDSQMDSISISPESLKLTFHAIHLTKSYEKITKSPSEFYISLATQLETHSIPPISISGLHYSFEKFPTISISPLIPSLTLSLCINKFQSTTIIGSIVVDMEIFKAYKQFKGSLPVMYRCGKTGTIHLDMCKYQNDYEFMTLSEQGKCLYGNFLPSPDYPAQFASVFSPTPKFNTFQSVDPRLSISNKVLEKVQFLKGKTVDFEYLLESLEETSPEILYYVFEKLIFFAHQSSYSTRIELKKILEIISTHVEDPYLSIKALWLLFYLIESSDDVSSN